MCDEFLGDNGGMEISDKTSLCVCRIVGFYYIYYRPLVIIFVSVYFCKGFFL